MKGLSSLIPARKQKPPVRPRPEQKFVEVAKPEAGLWSLWNSERLEKGRSLPEVVDQCRTRASGAEQQRLGDERPAIEENRQSLTVSRYSRLSLLVYDRSLQRSSPVGGHVKTPFSAASTGNPSLSALYPPLSRATPLNPGRTISAYDLSWWASFLDDPRACSPFVDFYPPSGLPDVPQGELILKVCRICSGSSGRVPL